MGGHFALKYYIYNVKCPQSVHIENLINRLTIIYHILDFLNCDLFFIISILYIYNYLLYINILENTFNIIT